MANTQPTTVGGQMISTAKQVRDQIVNGGRHIASQALQLEIIYQVLVFKWKG
jgi:hypothetical protein